MPNIKLNFNQDKTRSYTIHLGNCEWLEFKSKKYVAKYLAKYKKVLESNVRILNAHSQLIYTTYRQHYFDIPENDIYHIDEYFNEFHETYRRIFKTFSEGNQNAFVFANIGKANAILCDLCEHIYTIASTHKNYALKNNILPIRKMLYELEKTIDRDKHDLNINPKPYESELRIISNDKIVNQN